MTISEMIDDLKAHTDLSDRDAAGLANVIFRAIDERRAAPATHGSSVMPVDRECSRSHAAQSSVIPAPTEVSVELALFRADLYRTAWVQARWISWGMLATAALALAGIKLIP